jgi:hypothetical protein
MAHTHGNEYQVRIVHEDGTEELSGWMTSEEQVVPALAEIQRPNGTAYWVRARTVRCRDCSERDEEIWECPVTAISSSRSSPHDTGYLVAAGYRGMTEVPEPRRTIPARATTTLYSLVLEIVKSAKRAP